MGSSTSTCTQKLVHFRQTSNSSTTALRCGHALTLLVPAEQCFEQGTSPRRYRSGNADGAAATSSLTLSPFLPGRILFSSAACRSISRCLFWSICFFLVWSIVPPFLNGVAANKSCFCCKELRPRKGVLSMVIGRRPGRRTSGSGPARTAIDGSPPGLVITFCLRSTPSLPGTTGFPNFSWRESLAKCFLATALATR